MEAIHGFTPTRIVALAVIGVLVSGLAYLRFAPEEVPISVPVGAKAGDMALRPCTSATEAGPAAADCGTLVVPENRADPRSRLIALPVTRVRARSDHPAEPIFRLEGGPGLTNMVFPQASRLTENHDVVLVGYRGVDGSSVLDCPEVVFALKHSADLLSDVSRRAYTEALRACAQRLRRNGVDLAGHTDTTDRRSGGRPDRSRVRPDQPPQRERGYPHHDDLRVAAPEERPPVRDDRREPARPLRGTPRRRTSNSSATRTCVLGIRRAGPEPMTWRRPCDGRLRTSPIAGCSCRSKRATCG
jgi:hypothetical protein